MPSLFIGVFTALYPYTAQSAQELTVAEGDILYLLEKSEVDDWWKVKKRVLGLETEEPTGLVPNNYIQPAPVLGQAKALYEYDRQTEEELSFKENDVFDIYDANDKDWILVGLGQTEFGFVPSNYIEMPNDQVSRQQPHVQPAPSHQPIEPANNYSSVVDQIPVSRQVPRPNGVERRNSQEEDDEERPPSLPTRPNQRDDRRRKEESRPSQFFSWSIQEVDGRKKYRTTLAIGNGSIMYSPEKSNAAPQQWSISDLINYNSEKKHVFLEFQNPVVSLDLHAGSKEVADEIVSALGEVAGANRAAGLREVYVAANSAGQLMGKVLYDFEAQGDDEVSAKEGDNIFIIDNKKSEEWWMVKTVSGKQGVIPSSYVELSSEPDPRLAAAANGRARASSDPRRNSSRRHRGEKEREREAAVPAKSKPDMSKVRTWTDRSGAFKVEAAFLGFADGKIHLHKLNGVKIAVAAGKMSVEDLEYIERVTGVVLDDDKPLVDFKNKNKKRQSAAPAKVNVPGGPSTGVNGSGVRPIVNATTNGSSSSIPQQQRQAIPSQPTQPEYDWFAFFLDCGVDVNNCQRYAINFSRDQMDESVLEEISPQVLRNLGLKEGDILRVTKKLDEKFNRRRNPENSESGGLFSGTGGELKNNTSKSTNQTKANEIKEEKPPVPLKLSANNSTNSFDDDAWAIKSGAKPNISASSTPPVAPKPVAPEPTGALRDLLDMTPLEPTKTASAIAAQSKPLPQPVAQPTVQPTLPVSQVQPAQSQPILQPVARSSTFGAMPVQQQYVVPLQPTTIGPQQIVLQPHQTNSVPLQLTYTGGPYQHPIQVQQQPMVSGTGLVNPQYTGVSIQPTFTASTPLTPNLTGRSINGGMAPLGPFATGNSLPMTTNITTTQPMSQPMTPLLTNAQTPFVGYQPQNLFHSMSMTNLTNQFQQQSIQPQHQMQSIQQPMAQPFGNNFGNNNGQMQPLQGQPTGFGFGNTTPSTTPFANGFGGGNTFGTPAASALGVYNTNSNINNIPVLQPQKTGPTPPVTFGGAPVPLQRTPTGRRANLASATPNNPFGF